MSGEQWRKGINNSAQRSLEKAADERIPFDAVNISYVDEDAGKKEGKLLANSHDAQMHHFMQRRTTALAVKCSYQMHENQLPLSLGLSVNKFISRFQSFMSGEMKFIEIWIF